MFLRTIADASQHYLSTAIVTFIFAFRSTLENNIPLTRREVGYFPIYFLNLIALAPQANFQIKTRRTSFAMQTSFPPLGRFSHISEVSIDISTSEILYRHHRHDSVER
jgi:hypothetical protein